MKLCELTKCKMCGRQDVNCDVILGKVIEKFRTADYYFVCENCLNYLKKVITASEHLNDLVLPPP